MIGGALPTFRYESDCDPQQIGDAFDLLPLLKRIRWNPVATDFMEQRKP